MRKLAVLCVFVILLSVLTTSVALAQEADEDQVVFCGDLSDADCKLLNTSATALWSATSGESAKSGSVYFKGIASLESDDPTVSYTNRSMFVVDQATMNKMSALSEIPFEKLVEDSDSMQEAIILPLSIDNASITSVTLSSKLDDAISQLIRGDLPTQVVYETRMVDGILYINLAHFDTVAPDATKLGDWIGIDLMAFIPRVTADQLANEEFNPAELESDIAMALTPPGKSILAQPYLVKMLPDQSEDFNEFLEILPLRDTTVDGQVSAVYRTKMDVADYVSSQVFAERFLGAGPSSASSPDITTKVIQGVASSLMSDADATVVQAISYDDAYLYKMEMNLGVEFAGVGLTLDLQTANANINAIDQISAPTDAFVLPIRLIMGLLDTISGQ